MRWSKFKARVHYFFHQMIAFKDMKNAFYFIYRAFFCTQDIQSFPCPLFPSQPLLEKMIEGKS